MCVRFILASGRQRNLSTTFAVFTSGFVGPRHCIFWTSCCHEFFDGLIFQRCCLLSLWNLSSSLVVVIFNEVAGIGVFKCSTNDKCDWICWPASEHFMTLSLSESLTFSFVPFRFLKTTNIFIIHILCLHFSLLLLLFMFLFILVPVSFYFFCSLALCLLFAFSILQIFQ